MPHAVIEYSDNIASEVQLSDLTSQIHEGMIASGLFDVDNIKTRSYATSDFLVGSKAREGSFIHLTVSILTGRTEQQRVALSQSLLDILKTAMPQADIITVDIREMDKATYLKHAA